MTKTIPIIIIFFVCIACSTNETRTNVPADNVQEFIKAVDISSYPEISATNPTFYDVGGNAKNFLTILKENGVNTVRLRLWVNPNNAHSGFDEVKQFSQTIKANGLKTWLTVHYSDTWADPGQQETPAQWEGLSYAALKDKVYDYTENVMQEIEPDYIQIGNEINSGMLHPYGNISTNLSNFIGLMQQGISAVRNNSSDCKIIIHFAGIDGAEWFYNQLNAIDYDFIGLSYYPIWHGKSLTNLQSTMQRLSETHNKKVLIAETAYPFTLGWNDWTNNIVGLDSQLILPQFPATPQGQKDYVNEIKRITKTVAGGIGFCYWGAELVAWKGNQATNASPWENQALFDFNYKAVPALMAFKDE